MSRRRRQTRLLPLLAGLVALLAGGFALLAARSSPHHGRPAAHRAARSMAQRKPAPPPFEWPIYGLTPDHHRAFAGAPGPPLRRLWSFDSRGLLEFPPVLSHGVLYQLNDNAVLNAINADTGQSVWYRNLGALSASSPAIGGGVVYATVMDDGHGNGRVVAVSAADGHTLWQRQLPSASESSPLLHDGVIYLGSQGGTVYALRASDGSTVWTYDASGSVKGSPTYWNGAIYFGDYGNQVHAVSARTGASLWSASGSDSFYATAAVAFGRVYIGNTSGQMYAFDARTGNEAWSQSAGNDIYSSAAVEDLPGTGQTVFVGSYDGTFYALDATSGNVRWTYPAGGRISGSAEILGPVIYFADLGDHSTIGLDPRSGRKVFETNFGQFDPGISDGRRIYLSGYTSLLAYEPAAGAQPPHP